MKAKDLRFRDIHWLGKKTTKTVKLTVECGFTWEYDVNGALMDNVIVDYFIGREYYLAPDDAVTTKCISCEVVA